MKMTEERHAPVWSDEYCDDSDEDLVMDYLSVAHSNGGVGVPVTSAASTPHTTGVQQPSAHSSPLVPTISVTPHSPSGKQYPVLEEALIDLQTINAAVKQMKTPQKQTALQSPPSLEMSSRLSASCPSLPDLVNCSNSPTSGLGLWGSAGLPLGTGGPPGQERRSSWTALEDLRVDKAKSHRSISLSSLDSEPDSSMTDTQSTNARVVTHRSRDPRSTGGISTHSLNEADLQNDFNKIIVLREAQSRLAPVRLPLQKSVSTPSIAPWTENNAMAQIMPMESGLIPAMRTGTESETEEDSVQDSRRHAQQANADLNRLLAQSYDQHSEKRRKRGSLFFRKKKDKDKEKEQRALERVHHVWGSTITQGCCDWCNKQLGTKPQVTCENCGITVHYSACKDHLSDCKGKMTKLSLKSSTIGASIQARRQSSGKRGSFTQAPPNSGHDGSDIVSHVSHDGINFSDDAPLVRFEFLEEAPLGPRDLCADPLLGLCAEEPDSWTPTTAREILKQLKDKQIKRQEHIYEFILTEKHHCLTLTVMQRVFVEGLQKHFQLGANLDRMFPRLQDLTDLHLGFMRRLRMKQQEGAVVDSLADILLDMFSGLQAQRLKDAYGEFCSRHRDALETYKYYMSADPRFVEFIRHCQITPQLKKKGVPECILFVTQRLTKYPLLIEPLIKSSRDNPQEQEKLKNALALVKEILTEVDARVALKEKEDRKLEIYNRIDAKSCTVHRGVKFKKSDILAANRSLRFEGLAMLMQGRGKMQLVMVIVLSDCLFFLQESSHKYSFFTPDNKAGVVSLQKLLVREKAGQDTRGIYLISSNPLDPEMFELKVHQPKDKTAWIQAIRQAVQECPQPEEEGFTLSAEEQHRLLEAKQTQLRNIVWALRQKDVEHALLLEEKMGLQLKLLAAAGLQGVPDPPQYRQLVTDAADTGLIWREVLGAVQEVSLLANSLYAAGSSLSRSVSSAGERQSNAYESPTLPKRAETFGGFDNPNLRGLIKKFPQKDESSESTEGRISHKLPLDRLPWRSAVLSTVPAGVLDNQQQQENNNMSQNSCSQSADEPIAQGHNSALSGARDINPNDSPALLSLGREQQKAAVQLSHYVYMLLCIISQQMTSINSLQAQISAYQGSGAQPPGGTKYKHNDQLEELRNLQDKLSGEKEAWGRERAAQEAELKQNKMELLALQEQVKKEQEDIRQQREQLYRKMEVLSNQGLLISPSVALPVVTPAPSVVGAQNLTGSMINAQDDSQNKSLNTQHGIQDCQDGENHALNNSSRKGKWKTPVKSSLPLQLISATNQSKVQQQSIKQQIPLKLSHLSNSRPSSTTPTQQQQMSSSSGGNVQQMLPMKLSQNLAGSGANPGAPNDGGGSLSRRSIGGGVAYHRLSSGSPIDALPAGAHTRTGSSPAMMQATPSSENNSCTNSPISGQSNSSGSGSKPGRTNTYPKIPEKFRVRGGSAQSAAPPEEEVMFF